MSVIESSEKKVKKVLEALDKEKDKDPDASVPAWLHEREMTRLELSNRRLCKLALAGWGVSVVYVLIDVIARLIK